MFSNKILPKTNIPWIISNISKILDCKDYFRILVRKKTDKCRRALVDIPKKKPCEPCDRRSKKQGILQRIKLRVVEGGTNFGTPFRLLKAKKKICKEIVVPEKKALPVVVKTSPIPPPRPGLQVAILGADSNVGRYVALQLKQCPCIKRLRLYAAEPRDPQECCHQIANLVQDLHHINTNCIVQGFGCTKDDLNGCLQNADIVLMLESSCVSADMTEEDRFLLQAPLVKYYADCISAECPKAFTIVCASPIDCMVPLIAETLKETGWYNPRKLMGSVAVPEMRASTLAARTLCLEPNYVKVPCVGGTEGEALVPLFSKALEYFDFTRHNAETLTKTVRNAPQELAKSDCCCLRAAELSESHALAGLVSKVAWGLLCQDVPRVSGFVETDPGQVISPARYITNAVEIARNGIVKSLGLPKMSKIEITSMNLALNMLEIKQIRVNEWYLKYSSSSAKLNAFQLRFLMPRSYDRMDDCAYANL